MRSGLVQTEAIVLSKIKYSDSSNIISFYTKERGKINGLVKGARSMKSKTGLATDVMNIVQLFYYEKEGRELYTINSAELVFHPKETLSDLRMLAYSSAILELVKELTVPHEENERLYRGTDRILRLIEFKEEDPQLLFLRYFFFLLDESGVGIHCESCAACGCKIGDEVSVVEKDEPATGKGNSGSNEPASGKEGVGSKEPTTDTKVDNTYGGAIRFDSGYGILCEKCASEKRRGILISMELYGAIVCLITGKKLGKVEQKLLNDLVHILETYTRTHFETFKGLKALKILGDL
ncbi:MAG: DNA repair protein RecO [Ignavibacteriales bacterium]|nr:MAG: DNA repair protein RecO [Ignavibacteriaceae bacterium]MBW7872937.1 DNA repair protein RecO [Ignavibacteria bacterium]MCZ2142434.1 DNA repair protein RecO [Ignavibacteriales bacterium]OQY76361.1 MAG: DNA repair protein RecO [Ignavibacteriales bacterium UTCHB3]MBV6445316.1 DNA repair protein RecO [Ignavibacteriaceae bacterium]